MEKFKVNDIYIIKPIILVQINKYKKFKLVKKIETPIFNNQQETDKIIFLQVADDITIAQKKDDYFKSIIDDSIYPMYNDAIINSNDNNSKTCIHPNYATKLSELIFEERSKKEGNNISFKDILNYGIYESLNLKLDRIAEEIINQELTIEELKDLKQQLINKEKNKLVVINKSYNPPKVYEKTIKNIQKKK